jgi:hypothetical protein
MKKISKLPYTMTIGTLLVFALAAQVALMQETVKFKAPSRLFIVLAAVATIGLFYRAWKTIQDGHARTTPGKALGFSFIPVFNFYWIFVVMAGFASDFNDYLERHDLPGKPLPGWLFWIAAVCWIFGFFTVGKPLGTLLLATLVVTQIIGAVKVVNAANFVIQGPVLAESSVDEAAVTDEITEPALENTEPQDQ